AAKVIENTQRDVNIALMNELAVIFDAMKIPTAAVLAAANTKWNFLDFQPGLVGGHCIGVDPYYLLQAARAHGFSPQIISAARNRNDTMHKFIVEKIDHLCQKHKIPITRARVAILGISFKENVSDIRNSMTPEIAKMLQSLGAQVDIYDPVVDNQALQNMYGLSLRSDYQDQYNIIIVSVPHDTFGDDLAHLSNRLAGKGALCIDIKHKIDKSTLRADIHLWAL
ncbi:MAG: UDP binding domain-containing protein, partial [Pseudomonadota bacterium]